MTSALDGVLCEELSNAIGFALAGKFDEAKVVLTNTIKTWGEESKEAALANFNLAFIFLAEKNRMEALACLGKAMRSQMLSSEINDLVKIIHDNLQVAFFNDYVKRFQ